jgi:Fe-S-cluster-containing dehydrogenase component/anaerobic selenocysteine-containing dehydrogenase
MHVRCREGRVVKPEGNPGHPVSRGGLCPRGQSAPQGLYDPDRLRSPLRRKGPQGPEENADGEARPLSPFERLSWSQAIAEVADALQNAKRLFVLSDLQTGVLAEIMLRFHRSRRIPGQVVFHEAFTYEALRVANGRLFGRSVIPRYRLDQCDFILSFGADFLESWVSNVEFAWQFSEMHHRSPDYSGELAYIGPRLSMTAANADHFYQVPAGQEYRAALAILREVAKLKGLSIADLGFRTLDSNEAESSNPQFKEIARRFVQAKNSVALGGPAGASGPAAENLATAVMLLNQAAGRIGTTVDFSQVHALGLTTPLVQVEALLAGLGQGDVLIVHNANPAYHLPHLRDQIGRADHVVFLGTMLNETAAMAKWILPVLSPLEMWGDYEPWTGIHCLIQPTMGPLYDVWHSGDVFLALSRETGSQAAVEERIQQTQVRPAEQGTEQKAQTFYDALVRRWRGLHDKVAPQVSFELFWQKSLQDGGLVEPVERQPAPALQSQAPVTPAAPQAAEGLHLWLWPSILLFDGRLANRGWMQEIPERMSTITWGSWVDISPAAARKLEVATGDVIEVSNGLNAVRAPARVTDDVADNVAALAFGQGHTSLGEVANGRGANAFVLLTRGGPESLFGSVSLRKTGEQGLLISLSGTQDQYGRGIVKWIPRRELRTMQESDVEEIIWPLPKGYDPHRDLYPPHEYPNHRWAMVIDLDRCIGCGACTTACYAENNIPVMGPGPLIRNREMTWLQVPPYRHPQQSHRVGFLPLPCQHCDAAPCEPVCPVFAAVHNDQGLNAQIYNRCIGTRFCSNNCPYKVRRFGWFNPRWREPLHLQLNPDVTVRSRGVMEKCTFCVQRILYAERQAKVEGRPLRDGEVQPACVQSCPTRAFVFGDLMQPDSQVSRLFKHPRRYQLLRELNTKPAVIYLKRIEPEPSETT